jgi:hypothetical protein
MPALYSPDKNQDMCRTLLIKLPPDSANLIRPTPIRKMVAGSGVMASVIN